MNRELEALILAFEAVSEARDKEAEQRMQVFEAFEATLLSRVGVELIRSMAASTLLLCCSAAALAAGGVQLATVEVNEPGEWRPPAIGQLVASPATGGPCYWRALPEALRATALEHCYLAANSAKTRAEEYGKLNFAVVSDGPVWMLTNAVGFALEEAEGLGTPTWSQVPTAVVVNGTNYSVKLAVDSSSQFYRLKGP